MRGNTLLVVAALCLSANIALAEQGDLPLRTDGLYFGLGASYANVQLDHPLVKLDDDATAVKIMAGYRFKETRLPYIPWPVSFGLEAGYMDFDDLTDTVEGLAVELELDGIDVGGSVFVNIHPQFDLYARAGVFFWNGKLDLDGSQIDDESDSDLTLSIGATWQTPTPWFTRFEIQGIDSFDGIMSINASAHYQFK